MMPLNTEAGNQEKFNGKLIQPLERQNMTPNGANGVGLNQISSTQYPVWSESTVDENADISMADSPVYKESTETSVPNQ